MRFLCGELKYEKTRFKELVFAKLTPGEWSFFNVDEDGERHRVGSIYATKAELLADLARYAKANWGLE